MSNRIKEVLKAIRCCRDDACVDCPMQKDICDELWVDMESLPAELVDMIEEELEEIIRPPRYRILAIQNRAEKEKAIKACDDAYTISVIGRENYQELLEKLDTHAIMLGVYGEDGQPVGYSAFYANDTETRRAFISLFCIREPMQRKYLGSRLMEASITEARLHGMTSICLEVLKEDSGAIAFYKKMGFTDEGGSGLFNRMERRI